MLCPKCNSALLKCIDSRASGSRTRRRHQCIKCGERFSTYEIGVDRYEELKLKEKLLADLLRFTHKTEEKLEVTEDGK
jgi:transcriptional repressor NrdR